jgi:hypothetical protein
MPETHRFLDRLIAGTVDPAEIDEFVEKWHDSQSTEELHDYLGMSAAEYSLWLENPDMLTLICAARRRGQPLDQAVSEKLPGFRATEPSAGGPKVKSVESWLRRQGLPA